MRPSEDVVVGSVDDVLPFQQCGDSNINSPRNNVFIRRCGNETLLIGLKYPCALYFQGILDVNVLAGKLISHGYIASPTDNRLPLRLFSLKEGSAQYLSTTKDSHIFASEIDQFDHCQEFKGAVKDILECVRPAGCIICVSSVRKQYQHWKICLDRHQLDIFPNIQKAFGFPLFTEAERMLDCLLDVYDGSRILGKLKISDEFEGVSSEILSGFESQSDKDLVFKTIVCGGKGVGKSSYLKYIINKFLNHTSSVLYIDLDIGQPEFTLCGCVSAVVIDTPLIGPNYSHLNQPLRKSVKQKSLDNSSKYVYIRRDVTVVGELSEISTVANFTGTGCTLEGEDRLWKRYLYLPAALSEFILLVVDEDEVEVDTAQPSQTTDWTRGQTLTLIDLYTELRSFYVGDANPLQCLRAYITAVSELFKFCYGNEQCRSLPWFVNTMGMTKGLGLDIIAMIISYLKPDHVIQIKSHHKQDNFSVLLTPSFLREYSPNITCEPLRDIEFHYHEITSISRIQTRSVCLPSAARLRELLAVIYFSNLLSQDDVSAEAKWVHKCADNTFLLRNHCIFGDIIALCKKEDDFTNICYGFGIVYEDLQQHEVAILSPVESEMFQSADHFLKSTVIFKASVILNHFNRLSGSIPHFCTTNVELIDSDKRNLMKALFGLE